MLNRNPSGNAQVVRASPLDVEITPITRTSGVNVVGLRSRIGLGAPETWAPTHEKHEYRHQVRRLQVSEAVTSMLEIGLLIRHHRVIRWKFVLLMKNPVILALHHRLPVVPLVQGRPSARPRTHRTRLPLLDMVVDQIFSRV